MVMNQMPMNQRPLKRRRRITADLYDFYTFPAEGEAISGAPFRMAVRCFLSRYATPAFPVNSSFPSLVTWQILFRPGGVGEHAGVTVYIVEEDVTKSSRSVYCDQCRVVGWSGHPVCQKRYHIIIPGERDNAMSCPLPEQQHHKENQSNVCKACGHTQHLSDFLRCKYCNFVSAEDNIEEWLYAQLDENPTHLLHGVVHSNGYGHLITLNGREGGSSDFSGRDILNFWDRLCQTLAVRKISVMDVSRKYGLEYRLLHAVSYGRAWYGKWGYEFGTGSYGTTLNAYNNAITYLSSTSLSHFTYQGRRPRTLLQEIIAFYLSISDVELKTLRDLFSFILSLIHNSHSTLRIKREEQMLEFNSTEALCNWSIDDVKRVDEAVLKLLLATTGGNGSWVSQRSLKGALFRTASPDLLDYCLKHMEGKQAPNSLVVKSQCNKISGIEFRLEPSGCVLGGARTVSSQPPEEQLIHDLKHIYESVFHPQITTTSYLSEEVRETISSSVTKLLDCKHFVKDYKPDQPVVPAPFTIYIWCHVELADHSKDDPFPPPELLIVPENVSIADIKLEASKAFQEVYVMFKRFEAEEMLDYGPLADSLTLKLLVGSRGSIRIRGRCLGTHGLGRFRMERGVDDWIVDCECGAKDDDGEKMLACDECETWQHTRCAGIDDNDAIPVKYICNRCFEYDMEECSNDDQLSKCADKIKQSSKFKKCSFTAKGKGRRHKHKSILKPAFGVH